jgi:hypothetical protein
MGCDLYDHEDSNYTATEICAPSINGVMIGGLVLVAAPAEYDVIGVKTFITG